MYKIFFVVFVLVSACYACKDKDHSKNPEKACKDWMRPVFSFFTTQKTKKACCELLVAHCPNDLEKKEVEEFIPFKKPKGQKVGEDVKYTVFKEKVDYGKPRELKFDKVFLRTYVQP